MKCSSCGHDSPDGANFCANCGASLREDVRRTALDDLIDEFSREAKEHPDDPDVHNNLATAYMWKRAYERAIAEWERVLQLSPGYQPAREGIEKARQRLAFWGEGSASGSGART